jgi:hypothetical protein
MKIKTLNRLETHDRLLEFGKQADYISQGCSDCIANRPEAFGNRPFYIFAHCRTSDDGYTKRLVWSPRLTKPKAQTNSMLFKCFPPEAIKIIWMIPTREMWDSYNLTNMTQSLEVLESIRRFEYDREKLEAPDHDDLSEDQVSQIYAEISRNVQYDKLMKYTFNL